MIVGGNDNEEDVSDAGNKLGSTTQPTADDDDCKESILRFSFLVLPWSTWCVWINTASVEFRSPQISRYQQKSHESQNSDMLQVNSHWGPTSWKSMPLLSSGPKLLWIWTRTIPLVPKSQSSLFHYFAINLAIRSRTFDRSYSEIQSSTWWSVFRYGVNQLYWIKWRWQWSDIKKVQRLFCGRARGNVDDVDLGVILVVCCIRSNKFQQAPKKYQKEPTNTTN